MPSVAHTRTPMALGSDLASAVAGYLLGSEQFLAALSASTPLFGRARVVKILRPARGENRVRIQRTGCKFPDAAAYPVWGPGQVPQIGDDVLLFHCGGVNFVLGARAGGHPNHWLIPYPQGALGLYTPEGRIIAHHDTVHRSVHFAPTDHTGAPSTPVSVTFEPDLGDPIVATGTALVDLLVTHVLGPEGHALHAGDVFFGLSGVQWNAPTPQEDTTPTHQLPAADAIYGRHRVTYGSPPRAELAMATAGPASERLLSSHDPSSLSDTTNHRTYHDTGGDDSVWHELNRFGLVLPHGHQLVDQGTTVQHGSPTHPPLWHIALGAGGTFTHGTWALVYTYVESGQESAASPRYIGTLGPSIVPGAAIQLPAFSVPTWVTDVKFYLSPSPGTTTGLQYSRTVTPSGGTIAEQTFTAPGSGATAPTTSALLTPGRVALLNGNPHLVVSGGKDPDTNRFDTRLGVETGFGSGYFKFEDNCITFPMGETICDGAGGGGGSATSDAVTFVLNGMGSPIPTGQEGALLVPFDCTITSCVMLADQTSSTVVDIQSDTYSGYPTSTSIVGSAPPTLSAARKSEDLGLAGWTTALAGGTILRFSVTSNDVATEITLTLVVSRTDGGGGTSVAERTTALEFLIDGGGSSVAPGVQGRLVVPFACTITSCELLADTTGSIALDITKATYATYPSGTSICGSTPPTISSAQKSQDTSLTGWTTTFAAGDILVFSVTSASTIAQCTVSLLVVRASSAGGGGIVTFGGGPGALAVVHMTDDLTLTQANVFVVASNAAVAAGKTLTLPPAASCPGQFVHTMSPSYGSPNVAVQAPDLRLGETCSMQMLSDGQDWYGMDC